MYDKEKLDQIKLNQERWEQRHASEFDQEVKKEFLCEVGMPVKRIYTPIDLMEKGIDYEKDLGFPGQYPYTRGITPTMYRSALWKFRQYMGRSTPEASNALWKGQIAAGANNISIAFDLPCQLGYDPDHFMAEGEVGRIGVSLVSLRDWETALDGIDLGKVEVAHVNNAAAAITIASLFAVAEKQGINLRKLKGTSQNDILKEYAARGNYIFPPEHSMRLVTDTLTYCADNAPNYVPIMVCGYHMAEGGASPVCEVAFTIANAIAYLQAAIDRGINVDVIAPHITFSISTTHYGFLTTIAKLRAMRRLWAKIVRKRFKAKNPESMMARLYAYEKGSSLSKEQYLNNIGRMAIAGLAGALAGVQVDSLSAYDELFGTPTEEAIRTSIRIQQIVGYETGVTDTIDPLAGSYFLEWLTSDFEERVSKELETIDKLSGSVGAIEQGYIQQRISEDAYKLQKALESGEVVQVGFNRFRSDEEETRPSKVYRPGSEVQRKRVAEVKQLRQNRNNQRVRKALDEIKRVASEDPTAQNNLMPSIIEGVKAYATLGEMCDALREIWGEYTEFKIL